MSSVDMEASWSSSASSTAIAAAGAGAPDDDIAGGVGFRSWSCRPEDANSENERVRFVLRYSLASQSVAVYSSVLPPSQIIRQTFQ
jgi:hypothetical protein